MKRASSGSPVQVLTSTMSRHWRTESLTDTSWLSASSGASGDCDRHRRVVGAPLVLRELRRSWMSYQTTTIRIIPAREIGYHSTHTPFTTLVPTLVTKPFTFSDRIDDNTKVEPGSFGASNAAHSWRPSLKEARESCNERSSHSSSCFYNIPLVLHTIVNLVQSGVAQTYQSRIGFLFQTLWGSRWVCPSGHLLRTTGNCKGPAQNISAYTVDQD